MEMDLQSERDKAAMVYIACTD